MHCSVVSLNIKPLFPRLAGKTDITFMMLDAGAETDMVNSVGRTAAQMAAFVGETGKYCKLFGAGAIS